MKSADYGRRPENLRVLADCPESKWMNLLLKSATGLDKRTLSGVAVPGETIKSAASRV